MIKIICVGKVKEQYLKDGIKNYLKRIMKYHKIEMIEINDSNIDEEAKGILKYINLKDYVVTLEIDGNMINSNELANFIDKTFIKNSNIVFIVGGSDGLSSVIKNRSNYEYI